MTQRSLCLNSKMNKGQLATSGERWSGKTISATKCREAYSFCTCLPYSNTDVLGRNCLPSVKLSWFPRQPSPARALLGRMDHMDIQSKDQLVHKLRGFSNLLPFYFWIGCSFSTVSEMEAAAIPWVKKSFQSSSIPRRYKWQLLVDNIISGFNGQRQ